MTGECEVMLGQTEGITVPFGWKRVVSSNTVLYVSPSGVQLSTLHEVSVYLLSVGTCKCGLECPFRLESGFSFDPQRPSRPFAPDPQRSLCAHKRRIIAMATLGQLRTHTMQQQRRDACLVSKKKRPRNKNRSPFDSVLVSQLLAQRDKLEQRSREKAGPSKLPYPNGASISKPDSTRSMEFLPKDPKLAKVNNAFSQFGRNFYVPDSTTMQEKKCVQEVVFNKVQDRVPPVDPQFGGFFASQQLIQNGLQLNCSFQGQVFGQGPRGQGEVAGGELANPETFLFANQQQVGCIQNQQNVNFFANQQSMSNCLPSQPSVNQQNNCLANQPNVSGCLTTQQNVTSYVTNPQSINNNCITNQHNISTCLTTQQDMNGCSTTQQNMSNCIPNQQSVENCLPSQQSFNFLNQQSFGGNCVTNQSNSLPNQQNINNCLQNQQTQCMPLQSSNLTGFVSGCVSTEQQGPCGFMTPMQNYPQDGALKGNKPKKGPRVKKLNCVLDRSSPCPNIDVHQIPSEHHRPPLEALVGFQIPDANRPQVSGQALLPCRTQNGIFLDSSRQASVNKNFQDNSVLYRDMNDSLSVYDGNRLSSGQLKSQQCFVGDANHHIVLKDEHGGRGTHLSIQNGELKTIAPSAQSSCKPASADAEVKYADVTSTSQMPNKTEDLPCSIPVSSVLSNYQNGLQDQNTFFSAQSNLISLGASQQMAQTQMSTMCSTQNLVPNGHVNSLIYNNALDQRPDQNIFVPNSSVDPDGSVMMQQVKIGPDYSGANMFPRPQMVQQVNGMVNAQHLVRMSGPGGLITMLPSPMTSNSSFSQPQMVLSDTLRPSIIGQQAPVIQNNCFIMSNQPTIVTRPPSNGILSCQIPCSSNSLPCSMPANSFFGISKPQDRPGADLTGKEHPFAAALQILQPTLQSQPAQLQAQHHFSGHKMEEDCWGQKPEMKNEGTMDMSRSSSVPSNISMIQNCGQVLINGGAMPPMSVPNVTAVTTTMTQMIPAIGIAPQILGQPVQPMVQVINAVPFNSMQNAVLVPGGSNMLQQAVIPPPVPFNVIPPGCVPPSSYESTSVASSTPVSTVPSVSTGTSTAGRKRARDSKRKTNSQTVASMLQQSSNNQQQQQQQQRLLPTSAPNNNPQPQQQHQPFLQPPMLQTLTVLPQPLSRPLMSYSSPQIITGNPLGLVQPLGMLGGAVIPMGQVMSTGTPFQSVTVLQTQEQQSMMMNDNGLASGPFGHVVTQSEMQTDGSQSHAAHIFRQALPPVAQSLAPSPHMRGEGRCSVGVQSSEEASSQTVSSTGPPDPNVMLSSGGESCEWPDPVDLSAAVHAVVQEQVDEELGFPRASSSLLRNITGVDTSGEPGHLKKMRKEIGMNQFVPGLPVRSGGSTGDAL